MAVQTIHRAGGRRYGPSALSRLSQADAPTGSVARRDQLVRHADPIAAQGEIAWHLRPSDLPGQRQTERDAGKQHQRVIGPPARYQRAGDQRRTRPASGTVVHRNRITVAPCPPGSAAGGYRMGRWARLGMTLVVAAAVVVASLTLVLRPTSVPTRFVTVQPGDTLASIAVSALPGLGRADAIAVLESLNGLDGPTVQVGAVLRVPAGDGDH